MVGDFDLIDKYRDRVLVGVSLTGTTDKEDVLSAIEPNAYVLSALADVMEDTGRAKEASRLRRQAIDIDSSPGIDEE